VEYSIKSWTPGVNSSVSSIFKPTIEEPTASICWLPHDPSILAVGTSISCVKLYDVRMGNGSDTLTIMAHPSTRPRKVKGIRPDPFNQNILATFSDSAGEPIKLWDIRKGATAKPKLTINPHGNDSDSEHQYNAQSVVVDASWSCVRSGVLAVATTHQKQVSLYSAVKQPPEIFTRHPIHVIPVSDQIKSLSWQNDKSSPSSLNRLLIATNTGFIDTEVIEGVALSVGASGYIAMSSGRSFLLGNESKIKEVDNNNKININVDEIIPTLSIGKGIEYVMKNRTAAGYSIDAGMNLQVLSDELDNSSDGSVLNTKNKKTLLELYHVWGWVDRVESLHEEHITLTNCGVLGLIEDSVRLGRTHYIYHDQLGTGSYTSDGRSTARLVCGWAAEGWKSDKNDSKNSNFNDDDDDDDDENSTGFDDFVDIVEECESLYGFERASTLALWHGDVSLAVLVLQRNIDPDSLTISEHLEEDDDVLVSPYGGSNSNGFGVLSPKRREIQSQKQDDHEYLHLVSLVAMCIAGFSPTTKSSKTMKSNSMWSSMCRRVLVQLESSERYSSCYLIAACRFLLDNLDDKQSRESSSAFTNPKGKYFAIVDDDRLAMEDRIAFACTYMEDSISLDWLLNLKTSCKSTGCLEGLILTGLSGDGIDVLQRYADINDDLQTIALLVGRNIESGLQLQVEKSSSYLRYVREFYWLQEYRNLLNRWQLFIERASLDVELGKRHRNRAPISTIKKQENSNMTKPPIGRGSAVQSNGPQDRKSSAARVLYTLPPHSDLPHVFLRCHFCSSSLPVDAMQQQQSSFLRKQRSIINCCPNCKKPLPRCYVCQLYMGLVNPHAEFNRAIARKRNAEALQLSFSSSSISNNNVVSEGVVVPNLIDNSPLVKRDHNVLDFGRWFFFCQHCKHGGHASCIDGWFDRVDPDHSNTSNIHERVCGVNGCSCLCRGSV
jgi:hypothetical protein